MSISRAQSFQMCKWRQLLSTRLMLCPPAQLALLSQKPLRTEFSGQGGQAADMPTPQCQGFVLGKPSRPVAYSSEKRYWESRKDLSVQEGMGTAGPPPLHQC